MPFCNILNPTKQHQKIFPRIKIQLCVKNAIYKENCSNVFSSAVFIFSQNSLRILFHVFMPVYALRVIVIIRFLRLMCSTLKSIYVIFYNQILWIVKRENCGIFYLFHITNVICSFQLICFCGFSTNSWCMNVVCVKRVSTRWERRETLRLQFVIRL